MISVFKKIFGKKGVSSSGKPGHKLMSVTLSEIKGMYKAVTFFRMGVNQNLGAHLTSVKYDSNKEVLTKATVVPSLFSKMLNSKDVGVFLNDCDDEARRAQYGKLMEGFCDSVGVIEMGTDRCYCAQMLMKEILDSELFCVAYFECSRAIKKDVLHSMNNLVRMTHSKDAGTSFQCKDYSSQQLFNSMAICMMLGDACPQMAAELLRNVFYGHSVDDAIGKVAKEVSIIGMLLPSPELSVELKNWRLSSELVTAIMHNAGRARSKADEFFTDTTLDAEEG